MNITRSLLVAIAVTFSGCQIPNPAHTEFAVPQDAFFNGYYYLIDENGVLTRTIDQTHFELVTGLADYSNRSVDAVAATDNAIYVLVGGYGENVSGHYVYHYSQILSSDDGETFLHSIMVTDPVTDIESTSDGRLFYAVANWGGGSGLHVIMPDGHEQSLLFDNCLGVDVVDGNVETIYVVTGPGGGYSFRWLSHSTDGGETWSNKVEYDSSDITYVNTYQYF